MNRKLIAHSPTQVHQLRDGIGVVVRRDAHAHAVSHAVVEAKVTRQHVSKLLTLKVGDMLQGRCRTVLRTIDMEDEVVGLPTPLSMIVTLLIVEVAITEAILCQLFEFRLGRVEHTATEVAELRVHIL